MKKFIALMLIVISLMALTACATKRERRVEKGSTSRMVYLEETGAYCIVYDRETKVMYAVSNSGYNYGNFTLLVDANGNPLLYEGQTERSE